MFDRAQFAGAAAFHDAQLAGAAGFELARFAESALFAGAQFAAIVEFDGTQFDQVRFAGARFEVADWVGPLVADLVDMTRVSFAKRVVVEVETRALLAAEARFEEGAELRARYATVILRRVFFGGPSSLSGAAEPFTQGSDDVQVVAGQQLIAGWTAASTTAKPAADRGGARTEPWMPHLVSVQETDVSQLTVTDVDLGWCRFAGAHQLDELRF